MKRRNFLRNIVLGMAATLLPEILRPSTAEITTEKLIHTGGLISYMETNGNYAFYNIGSFSLSLLNEFIDTLILQQQKS